MPQVRVAMLTAADRDASLTVRGRTAALHSVDLKAEVDGVVQAIHFEKGDRVKAGQVLCEMKLNDRAAKVAQAQALVAQTAKQHDVDLDLAKDGFRSATQVDQSAASLEAAKAGEQTMAIDLENTRIKAPFDGLVDDRYVDVGDYMRVGDKCALLIAPEPFLAVGQVSEREVGEIKVGNPASATLVTGETVEGRIRFVGEPRRRHDAHLPRRSRASQSRRQAARGRERRHPHSRAPADGRRRSRPAFSCWTTTASSACAPSSAASFASCPSTSCPTGRTACGFRACPITWPSSRSGRLSSRDGERVKTVIDRREHA